MRTLVLGDIHGHNTWKIIARNETFDKLIFIGDYFDSFGISGIEQINNFEQILAYKKANIDKEVILLIGNHDLHYFPEIGYNGTSGYQASPIAIQIKHLLNENREHLQMAYAQDNILFTHAGVGKAWLERLKAWDIITELPAFGAAQVAHFVNSMWKHKPKLFNFTGENPYGDDMGQTPVWIRPKSLMKDGKELKQAGIIQVVGHTPQPQIDIKGKATGGKYYFIDTLGSSGEYLCIEDNLITSKSWRNAVLQNTVQAGNAD